MCSVGHLVKSVGRTLNRTTHRCLPEGGDSVQYENNIKHRIDVGRLMYDVLVRSGRIILMAKGKATTRNKVKATVADTLPPPLGHKSRKVLLPLLSRCFFKRKPIT